MKKLILAAFITLASFNATASTTCKIKMVLNESQFFLNDFENVQNGFSFSLKEYLFFYKTDASTNTQSVQILNRMTAETYNSSSALSSMDPLNVYAVKNGRVMAEMICQSIQDNRGPTDPVLPIDPPTGDLFPF